jgi:hypothetical protein
MPIRAFITPQDIVDAISETTYMAIFDDANTGSRTTVDASKGVLGVIARAHAQCVSYLPRIYTTLPPEAPAGMTVAGDGIPVLLKDCEMQWATIYAYRRHPECVRLYSAEPNGALVKEVTDLLERVADMIQQIAPTDSPPAPKPGLAQSVVVAEGARIVTVGAGGVPNMGDF